MKFLKNPVAVIAFLTIISLLAIKVNSNVYDDLFLIEDENLLSQDKNMLNEQNFFDLKEKLNEIRRGGL